MQAEQPVYLIDQGGTAHVGLKLTTPDGTATTSAFTVSYSMGAGITFGTAPNVQTLPDTATPGTDYTQQSGNVTFPAGTASGTVMPVDVATLADTTAGEKAETVTVALGNPAANASLTLPANTPPTVVINAHGFPYLDASLPIPERVDDLVSRMSLAEKVGQMTQPERAQFTTTANTSNNNSNNIASWLLGSILSGGGSVPPAGSGGNTPAGWANMVDDFELRALRTPLQIPLVYGIDSVHGDNNLVGATIFPHNIGMGATRDPALSEQEGHIAASETRTTGPQWAFAPCVCVARDDRWGRTFESYGEDPALVQLMETSIDGFQGTTATAKSANDRVLATAKHFAGDGGTKYGTGDSGYKIDQGITMTSRADFDRLFVSPYEPAVQQHHVGSIMPSYSSVDFTDDGLGNPVKMHANKELLTDVLKDQIGFDGFLISDYDGLNQIPTADSASPRPTPQQIETSINAGMDMVMVPNSYRLFETNLRALVPGSVATSRVDDAVKRILRQKFELGLFEHPLTDRSNIAQIGSAEHRAVARTAAAKSQVLLKNSDDLLPLAKDAKVYLAGSNADDLGNQTGGWTVDWQGASGTRTTGTTIRQGIAQVAPDAQVTYSRDGSAAREGNDVGIVGRRRGPVRRGPGRRRHRQGAVDDPVGGRPARRRARCAATCPAPSWSSPAGRCRSRARWRAMSTPWSPRGCRAPRARAWPTRCSATPRSRAGCRSPGRATRTRSRSTSATTTTTRPTRSAGACAPTPRVRACSRSATGSRVSAATRTPPRRSRRSTRSWAPAPNGTPTGAWPIRLASSPRSTRRRRSSRPLTPTPLAQDDLLVSVARDVAQDAIVNGFDSPDDAESLTADAEHELLAGHVDAAVALLIQASGIDLEPFVDVPFNFDDFNFDFPIDRSLRVGHSKLRVDRRRHARVRIVCGPTNDFRCRGVLDARIGKSVIAKRSFSIEPNLDTYIVARFNKSSYRKLVKRKSMKVTLRIRTRGSDGVLRSAQARVTMTRAVTK